jgi:hypothetical protein
VNTPKQKETNKPFTVQVESNQAESMKPATREFDVKKATNLNETTGLIKHVFTYAITINGIMLFKKAN